LESSTTDTTGQFSNMISAQQAYSAASQVVTTVNKMFDTLISSMR
jgi:flagellar hook protein FlgE